MKYAFMRASVAQVITIPPLPRQYLLLSLPSSSPPLLFRFPTTMEPDHRSHSLSQPLQQDQSLLQRAVQRLAQPIPAWAVTCKGGHEFVGTHRVQIVVCTRERDRRHHCALHTPKLNARTDARHVELTCTQHTSGLHGSFQAMLLPSNSWRMC